MKTTVKPTSISIKMKPAKKAKNQIFKTGSIGILKYSELSRLYNNGTIKLNDGNRGLGDKYDKNHAADMIESFNAGKWDFDPFMRVNQVGIVVDGSHNLITALACKSDIAYQVSNTERMNTTDQEIIDDCQVNMNCAKAMKSWSNTNYYNKAKSNPSLYPLYQVLSDEVVEIKRASNSAMKINWVGGIMLEDADLLLRGKTFTNLDIWKDKDNVHRKNINSARYKRNRQHVVDLLQILTAKGIGSPICVVSKIMKLQWNDMKFFQNGTIELAKKRLVSFKFKRNFNAKVENDVASEIARMLK